MGLSAKDSRVYWIPPECPITLDGTPPAETQTELFSEQVVRIEINPTVSQRKYGHDKSFGAQDVCSGIKSWDGSITTKAAHNAGSYAATAFTLTAGDTVWLRVWPLGEGCEVIQGYAVIDSDPIVMNLESGEPVEHNYRYSSKGAWTGLPSLMGLWGGYECECSGSGSGGGSLARPAAKRGAVGSYAADLEPEVTAATPAPVTAYQWNGTDWAVVLDEVREGFTRGLAPADPGTFAGQLIFVPCIAA